MRPAIGGEDRAAAAADGAHGQERIALDRRQEPGLRAEHGAVIAEKPRPMLKTGHDRMVGVDDGREHPFRPFAAVIADLRGFLMPLVVRASDEEQVWPPGGPFQNAEALRPHAERIMAAFAGV